MGQTHTCCFLKLFWKCPSLITWIAKQEYYYFHQILTNGAKWLFWPLWTSQRVWLRRIAYQTFKNNFKSQHLILHGNLPDNPRHSASVLQTWTFPVVFISWLPAVVMGEEFLMLVFRLEVYLNSKGYSRFWITKTLPCQSAELAFCCPLALLLYRAERPSALSFWTWGRERGRQAYLALLLLCFPLASIYSFSKEGTWIIYPFAVLCSHLGTITWSFTHCSVICGDWFSRPIIFTSKIWSVCPRCYWATPGYKVCLVVSPRSAVVWISDVPSYTGGILPFHFILAMKVICQYLGSDQEGIFKWLLGKDIQTSHRVWFTFQPSCIVLSMLVCLLLICIDLGNRAVQ